MGRREADSDFLGAGPDLQFNPDRRVEHRAEQTSINVWIILDHCKSFGNHSGWFYDEPRIIFKNVFEFLGIMIHLQSDSASICSTNSAYCELIWTHSELSSLTLFWIILNDFSESFWNSLNCCELWITLDHCDSCWLTLTHCLRLRWVAGTLMFTSRDNLVQLLFATGSVSVSEGTSTGLSFSGFSSDQSKGLNPFCRRRGCCLWLLIEANELIDESSLTATLPSEQKSSKTGRNEKEICSDEKQEWKTTWRRILAAPPPHSERAGALAGSPYCIMASAQYQALKTLIKKEF